MIKVVVNGALGKMGKTVVNAVSNEKGMTFIQGLDVEDNLNSYLKENKVDVVVDFTRPENRMDNVNAILSNGAHAVVGTTGFTEDDLKQVDKWCSEYKRNIIIGPNFAIGTIFQMYFAKLAAKHFDTVEIVEYHHDQKVDFPSGTAVKTAQLMAEERDAFNLNTKDKVANIEGARGADFHGIKIHSVRLPGMVAHQEIIFGATGQYLTLRHDATSRECYMPGVLLSIREVLNRTGLTYGLEDIFGLS
ncbi:MAG: 4-hydroxy-tetrahydrodipicolinate reductase [Candidatus Margulisbacteria bacterium]|nr:4-hydroxy-tetrahydrodipicolinate reductase [Candidatus Margulisiibacteriota bacterium]